MKLKYTETTTAYAFYVANDATASLTGIPDGSYIVQFAFGNVLDQSCTNFTVTPAASEFPNIADLRTKRTQTQVITDQLVFTLYAVDRGNVTPQSIDPAIFTAD